MGDYLKDYAEAAFRYYARLGRPEGGSLYYTGAADGQIYDIEAVENALRIMPRPVLQAVEAVYFADADEDPTGDEYERLLYQAGQGIPASRRELHKRLRQARSIFAVERGLRVTG